MSEMFFDEMLKGICLAIKDAQQMIDSYQVDQYKKHIGSEKGSLAEVTTPTMVTIPMPQKDGSYQAREIPLATLMHHDSLHLDEVRIKMAVNASWDESSKQMKVEIGPLPKETSGTEGTKNPRHEIELIFKRGETSEGIARANQELIKTIS